MDYAKSSVTWAKDITKTSTSLLEIFFDEDNIDFIEKASRNEAETKLGMTLTVQERKSVLMLMLYTYQQYTPRGAAYLEQDVSKLNLMYVKSASKTIENAVKDYAFYYKEASTIAIPNERPINSSKKNQLYRRR